MMVLVALTIGLVFWLVTWSLGIKPIDAFLVTLLLTLVAATMRQMMPFINKLLKPNV